MSAKWLSCKGLIKIYKNNTALAIRIRFIPSLTAFCTGGILVACLLAAILLPIAKTINSQSIANYGNALASLAAQQAVDATFNHDLVRLQVILQDVVRNPNVNLAQIHDVENKLLVQAGDSLPTKAAQQVFTSPITLHHSIAGYVSVTVNEQPWSLAPAMMLVAALVGLLAALTAWSLTTSKAIEWTRPEKLPIKRSGADSQREGYVSDSPDEDSNSFDDDDASDNTPIKIPEPELPCVYAVIHIKNLNVLQQQLNGTSFRETVARLEHIIRDVMALYGGHKFELKDNYYILSFNTHDTRGEALFNASCGAYLILELAGILDKIPLDLAALVSANADDTTPEKLPFAGLILEAMAGAEELINRRIEFMELGTKDGRRVIANFKQPFNTLLENQHRQLAQIL